MSIPYTVVYQLTIISVRYLGCLVITVLSISNVNELHHLSNGVFWSGSFLTGETASTCTRAQNPGHRFHSG